MGDRAAIGFNADQLLSDALIALGVTKGAVSQWMRRV